MGEDVKTNHSTRPNGLESDGRRLESRHMAGAREAVKPGASRITGGWRLPRSDPPSIGRWRSCLVGILGDCEALLFSTIKWEPSFYQGLFGPLLRSALRRGIAYPWGLQTMLSPPFRLILSSDSDSSPGTAPLSLDSLPTNDAIPEPSYVVFFTFAAE